MAYGLSASADGTLFPWIFNPPATYWDGASAFIRHVADVEGGFDKLKGKTIGLVHLDAPYGKEPIPLLQALAADYGFTLKLYPVPGSRRKIKARCGWTYGVTGPTDLSAGLGRHEPDGDQGSDQDRFPDELPGRRLVVGERTDDRASGGPGCQRLHVAVRKCGRYKLSRDLPDILKYVVDKGKSQVTSKDKVGENFDNRAIWNSVLIAEAIRTAQQVTGKKNVNGDDVRRGFENLNITAARLKELGLEGFAAPVKLSCADHNGHGGISVVEWDGTKWNTTVPSIQPIKDKVLPLINSTAEEYVKANTGWPKRTEACDKSS